MRIYLDDEGATPDGWTRVYWPDEAIALLQRGVVETISLDHDLPSCWKGASCTFPTFTRQAHVLTRSPRISRLRDRLADATSMSLTGRRNSLLGDDTRGTGYDVLTWIERAVVTEGFVPPEIRVHSANPAARVRMEAAIKTIERLASRTASQ